LEITEKRVGEAFDANVFLARARKMEQGKRTRDLPLNDKRDEFVKIARHSSDESFLPISPTDAADKPTRKQEKGKQHSAEVSSILAYHFQAKQISRRSLYGADTPVTHARKEYQVRMSLSNVSV